MITTKQPTDDMIEVAIVSMEQALEADGEAVPAGSGAFETRPDALRRRPRCAGVGRLRDRPDRVRRSRRSPTVPTDPPQGS